MCFFQFSLHITPEYSPKRLYFAIFILVIYFYVTFQLPSHYYTCNKVHVIPNYFVYMLNNYRFLQFIPFAVTARLWALFSFRLLLLHLLLVLVCTLIIYLLNGFSYTSLSFSFSLCACPSCQPSLHTLQFSPLQASSSLRTFISYLYKIHLS